MNYPTKGYKYFFTIIIISSAVILFNSCKQDFETNPPVSGTPFPDSIATLFSTSYNGTANTCTNSSCHNSSSKAGGLDLQDWSAAMKGSNNGTMVIPYNAFWSHLTSVVNNDTNISPVSTVLSELHKMPSDKVQIIVSWINNGAKSKDGAVANQTYTSKAFITNQAADLVAAVNTSDNTITRLVSVGGRPSILDAPHYITVDPQQKYFYVSLIQEGYVERYDINTYVQTGRIAVGNNPAHIAVSPDNNFIYVTNFDASGTERRTKKISTAGSMSIVDTATAPQMNAPHGMAITNDGQYIYVTSQIGEWIFKIKTDSMNIVTSAPIAPDVPPSGNGTGSYRPYQCILSPDGTRLYVTCVGIAGNTGKDFVRIYDANTLQPVAPTTIQVGDNPLLMKYSRNNQYIFVCNRNDSSVTVINASTNIPQTTIYNVGVQPHGIDFSTDGTYAYIACETQAGQDGHHPTIGSIKVGVTRLINMSNLTLNTRKLEMGSFPAGIVCIPY